MSSDTDELMELIKKQAETHDQSKCDKEECEICSYMNCPKKCIEHYFHDGCPACNSDE